MKTFLTAALALAISITPASARSLLDPLLGEPGDCYYRRYDEAHLKSHPRQMVETFYLGHHDAWQDPAGALVLKFGFSTRNGRHYEGVAICTGSRCGVEGDGGAFSLTPHRDGIRLAVDAHLGLWAESEADVVDLRETGDTVFLLYPQGSKACR